MKKLCILLAAFILLFSCKKNNEQKLSDIVSKKMKQLQVLMNKKFQDNLPILIKTNFMKEIFYLIGIFLYLRGVTVIFSLHHIVMLNEV